MEVRRVHGGAGFKFCGEIQDVAVARGVLRVKFVWLLEDLGFPMRSAHWIRINNTSYTFNIRSHSTGGILPSIHGGTCLFLGAQTPKETIALYSRDGGKMDPAIVKHSLFPGFDAADKHSVPRSDEVLRQFIHQRQFANQTIGETR